MKQKVLNSIALLAVFVAWACVGVLGGYACASAPPTLSSKGIVAFNETRVVKAADIFRDFVIDANAQTPPLIDTATARKIITWHEGALKVIQASNAGWQAIVTASLDTAVAGLPAATSAKIAPYVSLIKAAVKEIT